MFRNWKIPAEFDTLEVSNRISRETVIFQHKRPVRDPVTWKDSGRKKQNANLKPNSGQRIVYTSSTGNPQDVKTGVLKQEKIDKDPYDNADAVGAIFKKQYVPVVKSVIACASSKDRAAIDKLLKQSLRFRENTSCCSRHHKRKGSSPEVLMDKATDENADVEDETKKWLKHATETERQLALDFLGGALAKGYSDSSGKITHILSILHEGKPGVTENCQRKFSRDDGDLHYVRLMTPKTCSKRWMHTSWDPNPFPEFQHPRVDNLSSHFSRIERPRREFTIHPEFR